MSANLNCVANISTIRACVGVFAFDIYDRSNTGELNENDISLMLTDLYGKGNTHADIKTK